MILKPRRRHKVIPKRQCTHAILQRVITLQPQDSGRPGTASNAIGSHNLRPSKWGQQILSYVSNNVQCSTRHNPSAFRISIIIRVKTSNSQKLFQIHIFRISKQTFLRSFQRLRSMFTNFDGGDRLLRNVNTYLTLYKISVPEIILCEWKQDWIEYGRRHSYHSSSFWSN